MASPCLTLLPIFRLQFHPVKSIVKHHPLRNLDIFNEQELGRSHTLSKAKQELAMSFAKARHELLDGSTKQWENRPRNLAT